MNLKIYDIQTNTLVKIEPLLLKMVMIQMKVFLGISFMTEVSIYPSKKNVRKMDIDYYPQNPYL